MQTNVRIINTFCEAFLAVQYSFLVSCIGITNKSSYLEADRFLWDTVYDVWIL